VNEPVRIPIATLPELPTEGTVIVENLDSGEVEEGHIPLNGRFRIPIATDAPSGGEKRLLAGLPLEGYDPEARTVIPDNAGLGDRLRITIERPGVVDLVIDTFATEVTHEAITMEAGSPLVAASSGSGLTRQTPRLRRLIQVLAMAAEVGDPIAYAPRWFDRPLESLGGVPRNVLMLPTVGDDVVPIATGVALARAAGLIEMQEVDERYGTTVDRWLVDQDVVHGYEELGPWRDKRDRPVLFDPEDVDDGRDGTQAPSDAPLRSFVDTASGTSGVRIVYGDKEGSHGWDLPDPNAPFDVGLYTTMQAGWYLATRGQELRDHPCFATADCAFWRELPPE